MTTLSYRSRVAIEDLQVNECTMHRALNTDGARFWHLWFRVLRETDGQPDDFCVPMHPNGSYIEAGPGGKTWGLVHSGPGTWQVSPSINVLSTRELHPGQHAESSLWHQTPVIIGVSDDEPWIVGAA